MTPNIMIVGCAGSGKSTLARQLSSITGSRVVYLDHFYWAPGWVKRSQQEINDLMNEAFAENGWICDGNNSQSFALRVPKTNMLIWLDLPRMICIWRVIKRIILHYGQQRDDLPAGCPDQFNWDFLKWVWNFHKNSRPKLEKLYNDTEGQLKRVHLKTQAEVDKFIEMFSMDGSR